MITLEESWLDRISGTSSEQLLREQQIDASFRECHVSYRVFVLYMLEYHIDSFATNLRSHAHTHTDGNTISPRVQPRWIGLTLRATRCVDAGDRICDRPPDRPSPPGD